MEHEREILDHIILLYLQGNIDYDTPMTAMEAMIARGYIANYNIYF